MAQEFTYPSSAVPAVTIVAEGINGQPAPLQSLQVGGVGPDGDLHPLSTDNSGVLNVNTSSSVLPTGAATSANQVLEIAQLTAIDTATTALALRSAGSLTPVAFDEVDLTYVPSGNGAGQVATAVYKLATVTKATLTLSYDSSNRLTSVVKS
jgi:hypothetical protein